MLRFAAPQRVFFINIVKSSNHHDKTGHEKARQRWVSVSLNGTWENTHAENNKVRATIRAPSMSSVMLQAPDIPFALSSTQLMDVTGSTRFTQDTTC